MKTYRIVDENNNIIDELTGLSLFDAEKQLCKQLNYGVDCWLQEEY